MLGRIPMPCDTGNTAFAVIRNAVLGRGVADLLHLLKFILVLLIDLVLFSLKSVVVNCAGIAAA